MMKVQILMMLMACSLTITFSSCSRSEAKPLNPNGDSELALVMRSMHENGMEVKQQLLRGEKPELNYDCPKLYTAKATQPEKVATPLYEGYANAFESSVKAFEQEFNADRVGTYHSMIDACMNCHQEICPGPMVKIKKMYLTEKEIALVGDRRQETGTRK
jgi:hypothetical protein